MPTSRTIRFSDDRQLGRRVDYRLAEIPHCHRDGDGQQFLAGEQFARPDIGVRPLLLHFEAVGYDDDGRTPKSSAHTERCAARPFVATTDRLETFRFFANQLAPALVLPDRRAW